MVRLGAVFVAICMGLIAGSLGAVLYLALGWSRTDSALVALGVLTALAIYNTVSTRLRDRSAVGDQIADLSRGTADLARQVGELGRRVAALESARSRASDKVAAPIAAEIEELGALVRELAQSVAVHDAVLAGAGAMESLNALDASSPPLENRSGADAIASRPSDPAGQPIASGRFKGMDPEAVVAMIRAAVEANRLDLYLQPIVTLPQRKARYYEAVSRLRLEDGQVLQPSQFLPFAERSGGALISQIDNLMLFRCVQVVRRLLAKNREVGLFCNVSGSTLVDPQFFSQISEFMEANRAIAPSLVLEFSQSTYRGLGPVEAESLAGLADQGFRFSLDHVDDLRLEPRDLAERGFRFIKVPSALLLGRGAMAPSDIHPSDFAALVSRFGIELIAERIESESAVVELLEYDVRFGQGFLFSPPRPVRPEVMQGLSERRDVIARDDPASSETTRSPSGGLASVPTDAHEAATRLSASRSLASFTRGVAGGR